jgi:hypothetical protein
MLASAAFVQRRDAIHRAIRCFRAASPPVMGSLLPGNGVGAGDLNGLADPMPALRCMTSAAC